MPRDLDFRLSEPLLENLNWLLLRVREGVVGRIPTSLYCTVPRLQYCSVP